jgi:heme/copper-type cytochrome/quinol oxidase subunit 2
MKETKLVAAAIATVVLFVFFVSTMLVFSHRCREHHKIELKTMLRYNPALIIPVIWITNSAVGLTWGMSWC